MASKCKKCGECCSAFRLAKISKEEKEKLGAEFCYEHEGKYGIKRVQQPWTPWWAKNEEGSCVFLLSNNKCAVYDDRPNMCKVWGCWNDLDKSKLDASIMMYKHWLSGCNKTTKYEYEKAWWKYQFVRVKRDIRLIRARGKYFERLDINGINGNKEAEPTLEQMMNKKLEELKEGQQNEIR